MAEGGSVGIGVPGPKEKLEVNGTVKATRFVGDGSGLTGVPSTSPTKVDGRTALEFGAGISGKQVDAGKIGYQTFTGDALDIVGAGTTATNRKIKLWAEGGITITGKITTPAFDDLSTAVQQLRNDLDALNDAFRRHIHLYAGLPTTGPG